MNIIFTETEDNGIYIAELNGVTDSGVALNQTWKWDIDSVQRQETERLLRLQKRIDLKSIAERVDNFINQKKNQGIELLYKYFNEQVLNYSNPTQNKQP